VTLDFIKKHFPNASQAFIEANCSVGGLESAERKPDPVQALDKREEIQRRRKSRLVVSIEIIALLRRFSDYDCIATSLGTDDGDKRLRWNFAICRTSGREQTIVRISVQ
jgi:hypothetical protein